MQLLKKKIIKLNNIAETNVDINGIGMYTLGKYRKSLNEDQKDQFKKIFREYFLKSFSTRLVEYKEAKIVVISEDIKNDKYSIKQCNIISYPKNIKNEKYCKRETHKKRAGNAGAQTLGCQPLLLFNCVYIVAILI